MELQQITDVSDLKLRAEYFPDFDGIVDCPDEYRKTCLLAQMLS